MICNRKRKGNVCIAENHQDKLVRALPFETDEKKYMIRMTSKMAKRIIALDEDYDSEGILKNEIHENLSEKYADVSYLTQEKSFE